MKTNNMPLYNCLKQYAKKNPVRFHMPAHCGRLGFLPSAEKIDITELGFDDNLDLPNGVINQAQKEYAALFGAKHAFFLTNGSSQGNLSFVSLSGCKMIVSSNCHISVLRAAEIFGVQLVYFEQNDKQSFLEVLQNNTDAGAVLVVSPDYYGKVCDLNFFYQQTQKKGILFFVDAAHGAHFGLSPLLPPNSVEFCDATVQSTHKNLGAMTQTAVVLTNNTALSHKIKQKLNLFASTSPSYILLGSIDFARNNASKNAERLFFDLNKNLKVFFEGLDTAISVKQTDDFTKLVLNFEKLSLSGKTIWQYLTNQNIYAEMYDGYDILFYLSMFTTRTSLKKLKRALQNLKKAHLPMEKAATEKGPFVYGEQDE